MNPEDALHAAAGRVAVTVARLADALPALDRVLADVGADWLDDAGRAWAERAGLVRRALDRELDAALAAGRLVAAAAERLVTGSADGPVTGPRSGTGPRLGGTDARRVDDERGMSIARVADDAPPG